MVCIQRRRCKACGYEVVSPERARQAEARRAWWCQVARLIGLSRFKLDLSVRKTNSLSLAFKAFSPGYESVCVLMLEGLVARLQDPAVIIQTASVQTLARRLQRFLNKHGDTINLLLRLSVEQGTPTTTNALESKNSIFKPFSRIAKFFSNLARCEAFFAGVALMENFDIKTRDAHQGTSAMQRAGINLEDLGAADFFSAVGLPKPQISFAGVTD
jgi:hypothetical protein